MSTRDWIMFVMGGVVFVALVFVALSLVWKHVWESRGW